jgi:hypothetical protein
MNSYVLGQIRNISNNFSDPDGSYEAMKTAVRAKLREQTKICNNNLLKNLLKNSIGTPEIEKVAFDVVFGGSQMNDEERRVCEYTTCRALAERAG